MIGLLVGLLSERDPILHASDQAFAFAKGLKNIAESDKEQDLVNYSVSGA
jgi:hypothetical protein